MRANTALSCCVILQPLQCVAIATAVGLIVTSSLFFTISNMKRETSKGVEDSVRCYGSNFI